MKLTRLGSGFTLLLVGFAGCATPLDTEDDNSQMPGSGGQMMGTGGALGSGGIASGTGGGTNTGGAVTATGGAVAGTGGTVAGTGGTVAGTGGSVAATGGAAASTGGAASGGVECTGTAFAPVNGFYDTGDFCGYGFTYAFDHGGTIMPMDFELQDEGMCATGSVPACADPEYPGVAIGINLAQDSNGIESAFTVSGTGITVTYTAGGATSMQANILAGTKEYCAPLSGTGSDTLAWSDFTQECWAAGGTALAAGTEIEQFHLQAQCDAAEEVTLADFCLTGFSLN